jgi:hypothetical protein
MDSCKVVHLFPFFKRNKKDLFLLFFKQGVTYFSARDDVPHRERADVRALT